MRASARHFSDFYRIISSNIFKFCEALNFRPTAQQRTLFEAVQRAENGTGPRRIAVKSGQGPGKTTGSAIVGLWRSFINPGGLTVVTAPSMRQCRDVWLVEARRRMEAADPILKKWINITKSRVIIGGQPDWGVKLVTASREENAQGYHDENMSVIAEEASGVPREIITQFKGTLSNPNNLFLMIGNPNTRDCAFFDCFNGQRDQWVTLTWNAEHTARDYPHIVSPSRNLELEQEFGRDSDVYRVRVLGEFPHSDPNCVMSSEDLEKVIGRPMSEFRRCSLLPRLDGSAPAKQFGLDFARFGSDESVLFQRSGNAVLDWKAFAHTDPNSVVDLAFRLQIDYSWLDREAWYVADAGGMGQGIMSRFYAAHKNIVEFHNNGTAAESRKYANKITEAWFQLAKLVRARDCALPRDNMLVQQLASRQYFTNKEGLLVLESKDEYLRRGHEHSPDRAEALAYCFYDRVMAVGRIAARGASSSTEVRVSR